jgi:hypothetical protein
MRYFAVLCRHVALCTLFAIFSAFLFLSIDDWLCDGKNGAQAAGGGAAIGMVALLVSGNTFLTMIVTSLTIDVFRAHGIFNIAYRAKHEVVVYALLCSIVLTSMLWLIYPGGRCFLS